MSTDATFEEDVQSFLDAGHALELRALSVPLIQPVPRRQNQRLCNFFVARKAANGKENIYLKAFLFARELIPLQMRSKVMQKSIKLQHHISTREARQLVKAAKKHLRRSYEQAT